jgi:hypothetical protein
MKAGELSAPLGVGEVQLEWTFRLVAGPGAKIDEIPTFAGALKAAAGVEDVGVQMRLNMLRVLTTQFAETAARQLGVKCRVTVEGED